MSLEDIARLCDGSPATVWRVLSRSPGVNERSQPIQLALEPVLVFGGTRGAPGIDAGAGSMPLAAPLRLPAWQA